MKYSLISSIGPKMINDTDPIYEVAMRFPPREILLISSDEPDHDQRSPLSANVDAIREHFHKVKVPVDLQRFDLTQFDQNASKLATYIIKLYQNGKKEIVLDLSAGRGSIRQALSRAGEIALDYIHNFHDPHYMINCAIRSKNQPIITYEIGNTGIPKGKDAELLMIVEQESSQTALADRLGWKNQSEISRAIKRLTQLGLIEVRGHRSRELTAKGERIRALLIDVLEQ